MRTGFEQQSACPIRAPAQASAAAVGSIDEADVDGRVLVDVSNGLDFSDGGPQLSISGTDSVAERLQRAHPGLRVVKTLNTVAAAVMVDPARVPGSHVVFLSGDDARAKEDVAALLREIGWSAEQVVDLGGLRTARGTEGYVLLWVALAQQQGTADFNLTLLRA